MIQLKRINLLLILDSELNVEVLKFVIKLPHVETYWNKTLQVHHVQLEAASWKDIINNVLQFTLLTSTSYHHEYTPMPIKMQQQQYWWWWWWCYLQLPTRQAICIFGTASTKLVPLTRGGHGCVLTNFFFNYYEDKELLF